MSSLMIQYIFLVKFCICDTLYPRDCEESNAGFICIVEIMKLPIFPQGWVRICPFLGCWLEVWLCILQQAILKNRLRYRCQFFIWAGFRSILLQIPGQCTWSISITLHAVDFALLTKNAIQCLLCGLPMTASPQFVLSIISTASFFTVKMCKSCGALRKGHIAAIEGANISNIDIGSKCPYISCICERTAHSLDHSNSLLVTWDFQAITEHTMLAPLLYNPKCLLTLCQKHGEGKSSSNLCQGWSQPPVLHRKNHSWKKN